MNFIRFISFASIITNIIFFIYQFCHTEYCHNWTLSQLAPYTAETNLCCSTTAFLNIKYLIGQIKFKCVYFIYIVYPRAALKSVLNNIAYMIESVIADDTYIVEKHLRFS